VVVVTTVVVVTGGREIVAEIDCRRRSDEVEEEVDNGRPDSLPAECRWLLLLLPCSGVCRCSVISVSIWEW